MRDERRSRATGFASESREGQWAMPVLLLTALFAAPAADAAEVRDLWAKPTFGLCAADEWRDGVYVYTDYAFDDRGADTDGMAGGDFTYPEGSPYEGNGADLVELRLGRDGAYVLVGARVNTMILGDVPVVAIGIDDGSAPLLDAPWPFDAGVHAAGVRTVVTLHASGATVTDLSTGSSAVFPVTVANDTASADRQLENTLTARIPAAALGAGTSWTLRAAAGLRGEGGWVHPGGDSVPAPYDLAFVANEAFTNWQQNVQAGILASGDLAAASRTVDLDTVNQPAPIAPGRYTRIYRSQYEERFGEGKGTWALRPVEGLENTAAAPLGDDLRGLFVPYSIWIPEAYDGSTPTPLVFQLHGFTGGHLGLGSWADGTIDVPAIALHPSGRAGSNFWIAEGELDVLESFADVKARYAVDEDRVIASGVSMGGFGTYKMVARYPDLFAAAVSIIGTGESEHALWPEPLDQAQRERLFSKNMAAGQREMLENALHVPFRNFNGQIDWLVNNAFAQRDIQRFEELGYDYEYSGFTKRHHETVEPFTNVLYHQVLDGCAAPATGCEAHPGPSGGFVRDENPARVVYETHPFHFFPELGLVYDRAYWVSGLEVRDDSGDAAYGGIDVTSFALAAKLHGDPTSLPQELRFYAPTNDPYHFRGLHRSPTPETPANEIRASLRNLAAATLDLDRAAIDTEAFALEIAGDGPTLLALSGDFAASDAITVLRDGEPFHTFAVADGWLVLAASFGEPSRFEISR